MNAVLIIAREPSSASRLDELLQFGRTEVTRVADGRSAIEKVVWRGVDLAVVDEDPPDMSSVELCRRLREADRRVAVVVLSPRDRDVETAAALDAGADDYLVKPFSYVELLARVKALLRRARVTVGVLRFGALTVDCDGLSVWRGGTPIELSLMEFRLLTCLVRREGEVLTRHQAVAALGCRADPGCTRVIDVHIAKLRRKLEDENGSERIETIHGVGYRLVVRRSR